MRKKMLVLSFSDIKNDPRVNRQVRLFSKYFSVVAAGLGDPTVVGVDFVPLQFVGRSFVGKVKSAVLLKLGLYDRVYWTASHMVDAYEKLERHSFDVIVANDLIALPLALKIAKGSPVIFDAHEYSPKEFEDRWLWRFFYQNYYDYVCRKFLPQVSAMMTVCEGIAAAYKMEYGVESVVVTNAPPLQNLPVRVVDENNIKIIHHGLAHPSRKIELMIDMFDYLDDRFSLDLMLVVNGADDYYELLVSRAEKYGERVRVIPPVPMEEIPKVCNTYDIGLFLLPPTNFNYEYALPNKFFEFVQGRLMVAIGPSKEMARYVTQYKVGLVAKDFSPNSMAEELNGLSGSTLRLFKENSELAARSLNAENNAATMMNLVKKVLVN